MWVVLCDTISDLVQVNNKGWHIIVVLEPDPLHGEEEGSGHAPTSELSPGWNVDLTNQNH